MKILNLLPPRLVGNNGFVKLVDVLPRVITQEAYDSGLMCDSAVVQAARVSYSAGTKKKNDDIGLIHYLYKNAHTTPFEMVQFKFHIKAPLFVIRQWQRHRMSTFNEISGRYSVMTDSFWIPDNFRKQSSINKQSSEEPLEQELNNKLIGEYMSKLRDSYSFYNYLLNQGVSREMARTILPVASTSEFYWKIDLHNLLRFILLRSDSHAQQEIRDYSDTIKNIISEYCPISLSAFEEYSTGTIKFSNTEIKAFKNKGLIKSKSGLVDFERKLKIINE